MSPADRYVGTPTQLDRIEQQIGLLVGCTKDLAEAMRAQHNALQAIIKLLAEDEDQPATESLDGTQVPKPMQESRSL